MTCRVPLLFALTSRLMASLLFIIQMMCLLLTEFSTYQKRLFLSIHITFGMKNPMMEIRTEAFLSLLVHHHKLSKMVKIIKDNRLPYLFKIKNETTFSTKIAETIKVRTQCHYVMAAGTSNFLIY